MLGGRFLSRSGNWPPPAERVAFYAARAARHGLKSMNKNEEGHVRPPSQRVSDYSHSLGSLGRSLELQRAMSDEAKRIILSFEF